MGVHHISLAHIAALTMAASVLATNVSAKTKEPGYSFRKVGFRTTLSGPKEKEATCVDVACSVKDVFVIAKGIRKFDDIGQVHVIIREHRAIKHAKKTDLVHLANRLKKLNKQAALLRLDHGIVEGVASVEQWTVQDGCERALIGRVLLALPEKIIEIEASVNASPASSLALAVKPLDKILRGIRMKRIGAVSLLSTEGAPPKEDVERLAKNNACFADDGDEGIEWGDEAIRVISVRQPHNSAKTQQEPEKQSEKLESKNTPKKAETETEKAVEKKAESNSETKEKESTSNHSPTAQ